MAVSLPVLSRETMKPVVCYSWICSRFFCIISFLPTGTCHAVVYCLRWNNHLFYFHRSTYLKFKLKRFTEILLDAIFSIFDYCFAFAAAHALCQCG